MSIFTKVKMRKPKKSGFNLSHEVKLSCNFGELIPILVQEALPNDTFRHKSEVLCRFAPLLAPIMHRVNIYTHYFFVPNRLIWDEWEKFISMDYSESDKPIHPHFFNNPISQNIIQKGSVGDYLGLPTSTDSKAALGQISALPFRAYNLIYNEYYRDETIQPERYLNTSSGMDIYLGNYDTLARRAWEKDYFTSALPFPQAGGDVHIKLGESAPINPTKTPPVFRVNGGETGASEVFHSADRGVGDLADSKGRTLYFEESGLEADLSNSKGTTIRDFRRANKLQEWLEKNATAGRRYVEQLFAHFGQKSQDSRLQRPEYLGGNKVPVVISDVPQTSQSTDTSAQATLAGNATSLYEDNGFKYNCPEHGYIIGIMSVLPRTAYQDGIPKMFLRDDTFDYAFPTFANIGEQEIKNKELFVTGTEKDDETFGYAPRYSEYKYVPSRVAGDFRDNLSFWHLGRQFKKLPTLSPEFIQCNHENLSRIFAVEDGAEDKLWIQVFNDTRATRCLPYFGTPQL